MVLGTCNIVASSLRFCRNLNETQPARVKPIQGPMNVMATLRHSPIIRDVIDKAGRYDAPRLAKLLGWSLADMGRYLGRDPSTLSRSGSAAVHQDRLAALASLVQEVFLLMNEDLPATVAWFRTPIPVLDWTSPRDLILRGEASKVRNLITEVQSGFAA